jgi:hypothetical protein
MYIHYDDGCFKCIGCILYNYSDKTQFIRGDNRMRKDHNDLDGNGGDLVRYPFYDQALVLSP